MSMTSFTGLLLLQDAATDTTQATDFLSRNFDAIWLIVLSAIIGAFAYALIRKPFEKVFDAIWDWLKVKLQGFGWGFEKRYRKALGESHQRLKLIGITDRIHPPLLKEVYVSLRMRASFNEEARRFSWHQLFTGQDKRVVVLGRPGAGKSTLMDYLALIFSGYVPHALPKQLGHPLPVFVRLRDAGRGAPLLDLINHPDCLTNTKTPARFFLRHLEKGNCIVLLDGLDEVLDHQQHKAVVKAIQQLVGDYPENRYVVTCRVAGWDNQLPNFQVHEIQPFEPDDIRQFISAWYREVLRTRALNALGPEGTDAEKQAAIERAAEAARIDADRLWDALRAKEDLFRIARTPLILSLITLVFYSDQARLPSGRARLYQRCLEILLDEWDWKDKELSIPNSPTLDEKMRVMQTIGIEFLERGLLDLDSKGLEKLVAPLVANFKTPIDAPTLIEHIVKRSGILQEQSIGRYGFAHRALHDYLSAKAIEEQQKDPMLLRHVDEEAWREVVLIAAALVPANRAETLVQALYDQGRENESSLIMAGWCLAEEIHLSRSLRESIVAAICRRLNEVPEAGRFQQLFEALLTADTARAETWMKDTLSTNDDALLNRILRFVPDLDEARFKSFAPLLTGLITEAREPETRALAAATLAELSIEAVEATWEALEKARKDDSDLVRHAATWAWCELGRYEELGLVKVPAGEFTMGSDLDDIEKPPHIVYLPTFYISKTPVTVAAFKTFLTISDYSIDNFDRWNHRDDHPVVAVSWYDSEAFGRHYGFALPSEAEWEKAARGTDGRVYPWGDAWDSGLCNSRYYWSRRQWWQLWKRGGDTTPMGQFSPSGDSPYGCVDMAGNILEWTRSGLDSYPYDPVDGREDAQKNIGDGRVLRGGSFVNTGNLVRCAARFRYAPLFRHYNFGFRVILLPFTAR